MIIFSDGQKVEVLSIKLRDELWGDSERQTAVITTTGISIGEAVALFVDGAVWSVETDGETDNTWNAFTKAGPITDNRDGTLAVRMGVPDTKETELRQMLSIVVGMEVDNTAQAVAVRTQIETVCVSAPDNIAAAMPSLSKPWKAGEEVVEGDRRYYQPTDKLYKVLPGKGHITQANWPPDKTTSMWAVVDIEHAGTRKDPIPATRSMEYTYGKYYLDPEDSKVYLCKREGAKDGQTIVLHYLPHELIDQYFVLTE